MQPGAAVYILLLWLPVGFRNLLVFLINQIEKFPGFLFGYAMRVVVPRQWEVFGRGFDVCTEGAAYCHSDMACHFPLFTVAATVSFDNGADFPFTELKEKGVARDSDFAYEQRVLLAGGQTFFESERFSPSSVVTLDASSASWSVEGTPAHLLTSSKTAFSS